MICNLIGFGYGVDKIEIVINKIFDSMPELIFSLIVVVSAVNLMFYKRNMENNKLNYLVIGDNPFFVVRKHQVPG